MIGAIGTMGFVGVIIGALYMYLGVVGMVKVGVVGLSAL